MTIGLESEAGMLTVHEDVGGPHNGAVVVWGGLDEGDSAVLIRVGLSEDSFEGGFGRVNG